MEYKNGFGDLHREFWWGNENIHQLTWSSEFDLRIDLIHLNGTTGYGKYRGFKVQSKQVITFQPYMKPH